MKKQKTPRSFGTHDGTFHADEVTACALLLLFNLIDENKIVRTRDPEKLAACDYVCDVGGIYDASEKLFDHHQSDYTGSLSSAGMILKYLKDLQLLTPKQYDYLNLSLVMGVDAHDNGQDPMVPGYCSFSHVVSNFTPIQYDCSPQDQYQAFGNALHFVLNHLKRLLDRFHYIQSCRETVAKSMDGGQLCMLFDKNIPWLEIFFELGGADHPALFLIMPSSGNQWKLRGIPPTYQERMKVRLHQPKKWAGLSNEELQNASGIEGAIFCHKGGFVSVWNTKEDALKAFEYVLKNSKVVENDDSIRKDYKRRNPCGNGI